MYCKECGEQISNESKFCPNCGVKQSHTQKITESRGPIVEVHKCPLCNSILAPILNSSGKRFGFLCIKCDPDIINNECPVCHKNLQVYLGSDNCTSCGYSWRLQIDRSQGVQEETSETISLPNNTKEREPLICPKCHSTFLSANKKGYRVGNAVAGVVLTGGIGLLGGFLGSNKVRITCLKCGHNWEAGKYNI